MTSVDAEWPQRRSARLYVRVEPHTKSQIEEAAMETHMSVSDFVISAVRERARHVLGRRTGAPSDGADEYAAALDETQAAALDRMAADEGLSRAEAVSRLLDRALSGRKNELEADLAAIDASFGVCREIEVPGREADERSQHLARAWQDTR